MKIGHYMTGIWDPGGIASYIRRVSDEQRKLGHDVYFLDLDQRRSASPDPERPVQYCHDETDLLQRTVKLGLDVLHTHIIVSELNDFPLPVLRTVHGHQPYCPSGTRFLKTSSRPCNRPFTFAGCAWGHLINRCGSVRPKAFVDDFRRTLAEERTLKSRRVATVSEFMKSQMVRDGYPADRIHVLYLFAPEVKEVIPSPTDGKPRFLFAGRLAENKGVQWLLKAVRLCSADVEIDIAGDGPMRDELVALAQRLNISDRVTFHGWVAGDQVNRLLARSRAVVFPSVWHEPGGTVAFEAMVNGRAVIMSRVGGMPEIIQDGENGIVVEPNDGQGLANAMTRLAEDWDLANRLGMEGRHRTATRYALEQHVSELMQLYDRCIQDGLPMKGSR